MSLQIFRDGRPDRSRNKMSDAILAKKQKEDDHAQILNAFLEQQAKESDGTYGFMGVVGEATSSLTVPRAMTGGTSIQDRVMRVRARMASGEPVKSLFYDTLTETEILSEEDAEAYEEGWICPNCIQYQAIVAPTCNWRVDANAPIRGCGYRRDIF